MHEAFCFVQGSRSGFEGFVGLFRLNFHDLGLHSARFEP